MISERSTEDYLETIYILALSCEQVHQVDVARRLSVSGAAVNKALRRLKDANFVRTEGMHIFLTEKGKARAEEIYGKHVCFRDFLRAIGVSDDIAEKDACELEHVVSEETYAAIRRYLGK